MTIPFLRVPPFPRGKPHPIVSSEVSGETPIAVADIVEAVRDARIGGSFWGAQRPLPVNCDLLLAPDNEQQLTEWVAALDLAELARCVVIGPPSWRVPPSVARIGRGDDPWWLADQVSECRAGASQEVALVCALMGRRVTVEGEGPYASAGSNPEGAIARAFPADVTWRSPFTGEPWSLSTLIEQFANWRRLIDSNRALAEVHGVASWKWVTVEALLWDGSDDHAARSVHVGQASGDRAVGIWKSRTPPQILARLEVEGVQSVELEDGFIRSAGLGANCVPPLSIVADFHGIYFDPTRTSDLELMLEHSSFDSTICERASLVRKLLVEAAISKYEQGRVSAIRPKDGQFRVLVTGQVEDDRSILSGGSGITNLELLSRTRSLEPNAWIIYKPHPDVEAGHRKGHVAEPDILRFADEVERDAPITALLDAVDAVHVITSLAGFEALLRGKAVTAHGVPFYAGWGLTRDLGSVPSRRTARRSLDELVAAALLVYPRYLDPVSRLPCPAELLVERMAAGQATVTSPLVTLRSWQGRIRAGLQRLVGLR